VEKLAHFTQKMPFLEKWHFLFALLATALLHQYATFCAIGITYDSPFYVAAAQSFATKGVFLDHLGNAYTNWTPLFPVLLSLYTPNVPIYAKFLHLFSCLTTVYFLLLISKALINSWLLRVLFSVTIVFSTPLLLVSSFLWSESIFIALLAWLLYWLFLFITSSSHSTSWKNLSILILLSNLLYLQRNAGLFFILAIGFFFFLQEISKKSFPKKALIYTFLSLVSFVVWQIRNHFFVVNALDFRNNVFVVSFWESLIYMADIASLWLLPNILPLAFRLIFLVLFMGVLAYSFKKTEALAVMSKKWNFLVLLMFMFGAYIAFMLALRMNVEEENERYLAPLFPLFFLFSFIIIDLIMNKLNKFQSKATIILIVLWLFYPLGRTLKNAQLWHRNQCKTAKAALPTKKLPTL
jgi:hypothetical protein